MQIKVKTGMRKCGSLDQTGPERSLLPEYDAQESDRDKRCGDPADIQKELQKTGMNMADMIDAVLKASLHRGIPAVSKPEGMAENDGEGILIVEQPSEQCA